VLIEVISPVALVVSGAVVSTLLRLSAAQSFCIPKKAQCNKLLKISGRSY
jgi:hypothetical protein